MHRKRHNRDKLIHQSFIGEKFSNMTNVLPRLPVLTLSQQLLIHCCNQTVVVLLGGILVLSLPRVDLQVAGGSSTTTLVLTMVC